MRRSGSRTMLIPTQKDAEPRSVISQHERSSALNSSLIARVFAAASMSSTCTTTSPARPSAKRSAYLARLAVEERLGTRLDELTQSIGPLEAPSLWVDDLCTVQGIDYEKLRTADPATGTVVGGPQQDGGVSAGGTPELDLIKAYASRQSLAD